MSVSDRPPAPAGATSGRRRKSVRMSAAKWQGFYTLFFADFLVPGISLKSFKNLQGRYSYYQ